MSVAESTQLLKCSVGEQTRLEILPMGYGKNIYHSGLGNLFCIYIFKCVISFLKIIAFFNCKSTKFGVLFNLADLASEQKLNRII